MNQPEAYKLLASELASLRELGHEELATLLGRSSRLLRASDGSIFSVYIDIRWRNRGHGDILVEGTIATADCGPLRRLDDSFVVSPGS
jgi:hypothetical protein